tara:strand:+ start:1503 stop:2105 length:603 start_codon:yes stop_codon:yes gene_type:complete
LELSKYLPEELIELVYKDLSNKLDSKYHYHNLHHTKRVINSAKQIGNHYNLSRDDWRDLLTACLLHDYGFIKSHIDHEEIGAQISKEILPGYYFSDDHIESVSSLILITKVEEKPSNLLESIIRDADLEYIGSGDFEKISEYLKKEWLECGVVDNENQFYKIQYEFLLSHNFYTAYMQEKGRDQKIKNIKYAKIVMESHQ